MNLQTIPYIQDNQVYTFTGAQFKEILAHHGTSLAETLIKLWQAEKVVVDDDEKYLDSDEACRFSGMKRTSTFQAYFKKAGFDYLKGCPNMYKVADLKAFRKTREKKGSRGK